MTVDKIREKFEEFLESASLDMVLDCELFSSEPNNYTNSDTRLAFDLYSAGFGDGQSAKKLSSLTGELKEKGYVNHGGEPLPDHPVIHAKESKNNGH